MTENFNIENSSASAAASSQISPCSSAPKTNRLMAALKTIYTYVLPQDKENARQSPISVLSVQSQPRTPLAPLGLAASAPIPTVPSPKIDRKIAAIQERLDKIREIRNGLKKMLSESLILRDGLEVTYKASSHKTSFSDEDRRLLSMLHTKFHTMRDSLAENVAKVKTNEVVATMEHGSDYFKIAKKVLSLQAAIQSKVTESNDKWKRLYESSGLFSLAGWNSWLRGQEAQPKATLDASIALDTRLLDNDIEESFSLLQKVSVLRTKAEVASNLYSNNGWVDLSKETQIEAVEKTKAKYEKEAVVLKKAFEILQTSKAPHTIKDFLMKETADKIAQRLKEFDLAYLSLSNTLAYLKSPNTSYLVFMRPGTNK
jgi:hypothetical protein